MKRIIVPLLLMVTTYSSAQDAVYFVSDPTLSPDASTIYFSYDGDLWQVPAGGGQAVRITAMEGVESLPSVSPDGKWIAFSSTQLGNNDVYVMPTGGGPITQLTFNDANDEVESWSWDSGTIYFTSNRENRFSTFTIPVAGGTPVRLYPHYFNNIHNATEHPDGSVFFNETWESKNFAHRKRYKGAYNPDIKSYRDGEFKKWTEWEGKDFWATIDRQGNIYFVSDEHNGEYNLYTFENGNKTRLTDLNTSVIRPRVAASGNLIVYTRDYQLYTYDPSAGTTARVDIRLNNHSVLNQVREFNVKGNITAFDISPDKKKVAFVSRGELFVSDIKGKFIKQLPASGTERITEVFWLANSKDLVYSKSREGYFNYYKRSADGSGVERELTSDTVNNRLMDLNSARTQAVYLSGRNELRMIDLTSFVSRTIVTDEFWAMYNPQPRFSPDDNYVMYTAIRDFERDILVYDIKKGTSVNLTNTGVTETNPAWSPDGKYIYFDANLTEPSYPRGGGGTDIYRVPLTKFDDPFRSDKFEEIFREEEKVKEPEDSKKKKTEKKEEPAKQDTKEPIHIDANRFMERIELVGPSFGNQNGTDIFIDKDKTYVYYISSHDEGTPKLWKTTYEEFERPKNEKAGDDRVFGYSIVSVDDSHYMLKGGDLYTFTPSSGKTDKIDISFTFSRSFNEEFKQMFFEAWAGFGENYYDEDFHGQDWEALRDKYAAFLPYISSRQDLRTLFNDMLGELNTSHFGFASSGDEEDTYFGTRSLATGIVFQADAPFTVERVVRRSPADKGQDIRKGDVLVAVNGTTVDPAMNRESYFNAPNFPEEITLTFTRGSITNKVNIHPTSTSSIRGDLYDEWIDSNQEYVDSKSEKRIAYIHMKNMGVGELDVFLREMVSEGHDREALILDLRYNTGGNVHDEVLRFLSQKKYMNWKYREGKPAPQSNFAASEKPIVVLINEQSLSDAEVTSHGFKELGLGTLIGTETYRWIIFTSGKGLVDGSFYRLPSWGCYDLAGNDLELTGVKPDIEVGKGFTDRLNGNHPQLDKAIEEILSKLR